MIEYSEHALAEAGTTFRRIEGFVERGLQLLGPVEPQAVPAAFAAAMDDDLAVPAALAVLQQVVREGNALLADGPSDALRTHVAHVRAMLDVLGLDPYAQPWASRAGGEGDSLRGVVDTLVSVLLDQRAQARARRDFAAADAIRDRLAAAGVVVEDTAAGPRWTLEAGD
jgi:cysteinyl-tRNA synthetase